MRIKMTRNKHGSPDGFSVTHYVQDEEYDVPEGLAKAFVEHDKVAKYVDAEATGDQAEAARIAAEKEAAKVAKAAAAAEAKAEKAEQVAKNKALKAAPQNKSAG
jgi:hypothetical protein